jgi:hypothetical protein
MWTESGGEVTWDFKQANHMCYYVTPLAAPLAWVGGVTRETVIRLTKLNILFIDIKPSLNNTRLEPSLG